MEREKTFLADLIVYAPHPDDAELFCGGTIAKLTCLGHDIRIVDLTQGELSTQGNLKTRKVEALAATEILNLKHRMNLKLPDGAINQYDKAQLEKCVESIRELKPKIVAIPFSEERHPDHEAAALILKRAIFLAALVKFKTKKFNFPHTVHQTIMYPMRVTGRVSFVIDTTAFNDTKFLAINSFKSQILRAKNSTTLVSSDLSLTSIGARDAYYGSKIGVSFGEPFIINHPLAIDNPIAFFTSKTPLLFDRI